MGDIRIKTKRLANDASHYEVIQSVVNSNNDLCQSKYPEQLFGYQLLKLMVVKNFHDYNLIKFSKI